MTRFASICLLLLAATAVTAQTDCEVGIWFDVDGAWIRGDSVEVGQTAHAYLILTPPDGPLLLESLVQSIDLERDTGAWVELRGGGVNQHTPWGATDLTVQGAWSTPLPLDGPTVVADLHIPVVDDHALRIYAECGAFGNVSGETATRVWEHCTYCGIMPPPYTTAAIVNYDHLPVGDESTSWSAVKSIYR